MVEQCSIRQQNTSAQTWHVKVSSNVSRPERSRSVLLHRGRREQSVQTIGEIADEVDRERWTVYRPLQRLLQADSFRKNRSTTNRGYNHVVQPTDPDIVADELQRILNDRYAKMDQLIQEFRSKYGTPGQPAAILRANLSYSTPVWTSLSCSEDRPRVPRPKHYYGRRTILLCMFVVTTIGSGNATTTVLPFIAGKGAMNRGETVAVFAMQEATRLATDQHSLEEIKAPGLPTVAEVLDVLQENDALDEFVVCEPCAAARNITEDDLADWATFGSATDLARLSEDHETTVTF